VTPIRCDGAGASRVVARLARLHPLDDGAREALAAALARARPVQPRRELLQEGAPVREPLLVLDGWGAKVRHLLDGRRQILQFVLPGDLLGREPKAQAPVTAIAVTPMEVCPAPERTASPALDAVYAAVAALEEAYLHAQIVRLGRMSAHERVIDLLLELYERLEPAGLAQDGRFTVPVTQEVLADALGLTAVHVNRMLQRARRAGDLSFSGRELMLHDPAALGRKAGRPRPWPRRIAAGDGSG
jgi:CRP-like cAMP-binding protein